MTPEMIKSLEAPKGRPAGDSYDNYMKLCFQGGVGTPLTKSQWTKLPEVGGLLKAAKGCAEDVKDHEDEFHGEKLKKDSVIKASEEEDEDAGDEDDMKAIDAYQTVEEALDTPTANTSREAFLQARLDAGTISKSERVELGRIWTDETEEVPELLHKSLTETIQEDDNAGHLVDASDFLRTLVKGVDTRMEQVLGEVGRDGRATRELMKAQGSLIKSLAAHAGQQDSVIKAMAERLETVERLPAPRRAVTARPETARAREFAKSAVAEAGDNTLSKSQVADGLRALMIHASESEDQGAMNRIAHATSLYEQTGRLPENVMTAVRRC